MVNSWKLLWQSRKFWLLVLDIVIGTVMLIVSRYFQTETEFVLKIIAIYQPLFIFIIGAIAVEDAASKAGSGNKGTIPPFK